MDANTESGSKIKQQPDQQREQNIQKISEEDRALILAGPATDEALQSPAIYPPPPDNLWSDDNANVHYGLGWILSPARLERLHDLFFVNFDSKHDVTIRTYPNFPNWRYQAYKNIFTHGAHYPHHFHMPVCEVNAPQWDNDDSVQSDAWVDAHARRAILIDGTSSPYQNIRPTQAQYDYLVKGMGSEPGWYRCAYLDGISHKMARVRWVDIGIRCDDCRVSKQSLTGWYYPADYVYILPDPV
ncbi:hypothetical protein ONZ51_g12579 [Trametes cubensis]|uniref:Uncharacterized protein n=1 Tax=Trametes cubensis TaxID=1111947 RepID=A0AAD7TI08_9APHY|nr:hypothetical protein ONZ51_g12579 [Trametes cubensis]